MAIGKRIGGVAIALVFFAGACGGDEELQQRPLPVFAPETPIEELLGVPIDPVDAKAWDETIEQISIVNCMAAQGFEYVPDPAIIAIRPTAFTPGQDFPEVEPELVALDETQQRLASVRSSRRALDLESDEAETLRQTFDPNFRADRSIEEQNDWARALFGGAVSSSGLPASGCLSESVAATSTSPGRNPALIAQFHSAVADAYANDTVARDGATAWADCIASFGYDYQSPAEAEWALRQQANDAYASANQQLQGIEFTDATERNFLDDLIVALEPLAALEAEVAQAHETCAVDWFAARAAVRQTVADGFVTGNG
ncbi:MAG: hypothetical protein AAF567_13405 [Actinomycetota bacterium]